MPFAWTLLKQPFLCLAPMEGATDAAFRQVVIGCGRPDVCFTEFTNVEGLTSKGKRMVEQRLLFDPVEQPLIAQVWGINPDNFFTIAQSIVKRGFAGIDINMACPDRAVVKKGSGGALINNPSLAHEIIEAVKVGVGGKIPVSVKTRIGFNKIITEEWVSFLLSHNLAALTVHGRTVKELSKVPAHWDEIGKAVAVRNDMKVKTVMIGNGDILSRQQAEQYAVTYGVEGVMIGRGVFYDPWVFEDKGLEVRDSGLGKRTKRERLALLLKHLDLYQSYYNGDRTNWGYDDQGRVWKPFEPLKRYFKIYVQGFAGAGQLREKLMLTKQYDEVKELVNQSLIRE